MNNPKALSNDNELKFCSIDDELKFRYKEFFESKFAVEILKNDNNFSSVKKVSSEIYKLIKANQTIVLDTIKSESKIINELRVPFFGSCYGAVEEVTPSQVLEKNLRNLVKRKG